MADEPIRIQFDRSRMTFGEMVDFEDIAGVPVTTISEDTIINSRILLAMIYISMKRNDPKITLDDVRDLNVDAVQFVDPTQAEPTPLKPLEQPKGTTKRAKAS